MQRKAFEYLKAWLYSKQRLPLVIRGARQVGKTWLIRRLAEVEGKELIELNFEKKPELLSLFDTNDPKEILNNIGAFYNKNLVPKNILLFFDEVQVAPVVLAKLRWFAEEIPELAVAAAGSLLEFVLGSQDFSMPVGRISYVHIEPLSFEEFLIAGGNEKLKDFLVKYELKNKIPEALHQQLMEYFREYIIVGGMPAVVSSWIENKNLIQVEQIQHDLLATYRDDFAKYKGKLPIERLDEIIMAMPRLLAEKFSYSKVNKDVQSSSLKQALSLLSKARLCHMVYSCSANGIPLGAEIRNNFYKIILLDVGLISASLGLRLNQMKSIGDINLINQGGISEQVVGQLLRTLEPFYIEPALYYWTREEKGSSAEVDYIIQHNNQIIPIEVKSGSTGNLKSLHLFMQLKQLPIAVRINSGFPVETNINIKIYDGKLVQYQLLSIPFYLLEQLPRILDSNI
jgi:predicted AAA+ superfamily ATPase